MRDAGRQVERDPLTKIFPILEGGDSTRSSDLEYEAKNYAFSRGSCCRN